MFTPNLLTPHRNPKPYRVASILAALAIPTAAIADNDSWPELRGPGGQGVHPVESAPLNWGPDENVV